MIIIEGPDHVGKTRVAKAISAKTGLIYRHLGPPPAGFDHVQGYLGEEVYGPYVWDRFHLGEHVYGKKHLYPRSEKDYDRAIHGSRSGTTKEQLQVMRELMTRGAIVLIIYASDCEQYSDLASQIERNELYTKWERGIHNARFKKLAEENTTYSGNIYCDVTHDISTEDYMSDDDIDYVIDFWRRRQADLTSEEFKICLD